MATRIQVRRDTAANWLSVIPTLAQGEIGFESDTNKFKIGDGVTSWPTLPYAATTSTLGENAILSNLSVTITATIQNLYIGTANIANSLASASASIATNTTNIANISLTVSSQASQINLLTTTVNQHTTQIGEVSLTVSNHSSQIVLLTTTVNQHTTQISEVSLTVYNNSSQIALLTTTVNQQTTLLASASASIATNTTNIANISLTVSNHSSQIVLLTTTVNLHTTQISEVSLTVSNNSSQIVLLTTTVNQHTTLLASASASIATNTTNIANISLTVSNQASQISLLTTTVNNHSSQINLLTTTVNQHTTQIGEVSLTVSNHSSQIVLLTTTVNNHSSQINLLTVTVNDHSSQINLLTTTVNQHTTQIAEVSLTVSQFAYITIGNLVAGVGISILGGANSVIGTVTIANTGLVTDPLIISNLSVTVTATIQNLYVGTTNVANSLASLSVSVNQSTYPIIAGIGISILGSGKVFGATVTVGTTGAIPTYETINLYPSGATTGAVTSFALSEPVGGSTAGYNKAATNNAGPAQNDELDWAFTCNGGTYKIQIQCRKSSAAGIATWLLDAGSVGTIDFYNSTNAHGQILELTGVAISAGSHTLGMKMATKHASSSDYQFFVHSVNLIRTGA